MIRSQKVAIIFISILSVLSNLSCCHKGTMVRLKAPDRELMIRVDKNGFYHPTSEEEVVVLVKYAKENRLQVRVRGSAHSVAKAIYTDNFKKNQDKTPETELNIVLDRMIKVSFDDTKKEVTAEAGCHLGEDPEDCLSGNFKKSLFYQLDQHGWALPSAGGISHQTVGGFVATGSAGGSVQFSVGDQIVAMKIVDGNGSIWTLSETENPEKFHAAGVSMGLLGIITSGTFKCVEKFHIIGNETTTNAEQTKIDIFSSGNGSNRPSLQHFFENTEHARILWWPQKNIEKMAVWQGRRMMKEDYIATGTTPENFDAQPYELFSSIKPVSKLIQFFAGLHFSSIEDWHERTNDPELQSRITQAINTFVEDGTQEFWDTWWHGLPMDIELDDKLLPTEFTELWVSIDKTEEVMNTLLTHYQTNGLSATGPYALEIYAAKQSRFWMSPSYGGDRLRINIFWFKNFKGNPDEIYFPQFWDLLKNFGYRFHWGKYMPKNPDYLRKQYPKWDEFMKIRKEMDPDQIFLTDYWRERLGIPSHHDD
ncbi:MAG: FAD-binding protein [Aliifodinibius sp.]|nr:FAD-binding protein [Fodinibius sp.]